MPLSSTKNPPTISRRSELCGQIGRQGTDMTNNIIVKYKEASYHIIHDYLFDGQLDLHLTYPTSPAVLALPPPSCHHLPMLHLRPPPSSNGQRLPLPTPQISPYRRNSAPHWYPTAILPSLLPPAPAFTPRTGPCTASSSPPLGPPTASSPLSLLHLPPLLP